MLVLHLRWFELSLWFREVRALLSGCDCACLSFTHFFLRRECMYGLFLNLLSHCTLRTTFTAHFHSPGSSLDCCRGASWCGPHGSVRLCSEAQVQDKVSQTVSDGIVYDAFACTSSQVGTSLSPSTHNSYHSETELPYGLVYWSKGYCAFFRLPGLHLRMLLPWGMEVLIGSCLLHRWSSCRQGSGGHFP